MANGLEKMGQDARAASYKLATYSTKQKNALLTSIADGITAKSTEILAANAKDIAEAKKNGLEESMIDRLLLTPERIKDIVSDVLKVVSLQDPVGTIIAGNTLDSGLTLIRKRVPLGVIATIYEARPNVTIDIACLCLKTGNAAILRGGKETRQSNIVLTQIIMEALSKHALPITAVQSITDPDRALALNLLHLDKYVDMLIPRGGAGLHRFCIENSRIPVITGGIGICHIIVDESANQEKSLGVIANAKTQRPSTCNTLETLLVHSAIAKDFLPKLATQLNLLGVTFHASLGLYPFARHAERLVAVTIDNYQEEWLGLDLNVEIVDNLDAAITHIRSYGTGHSDGILTESLENSNRFVAEVDSATLYVNASTRFTDGAQFGLGAEVAVSTQKLHARGPMALEALTTYKWIAHGDYTVRA